MKQMLDKGLTQPLKHKNCIVCGSPDQALLYPGILRCKNCSFVFADTKLSEAQLFELYQKDYFFGDEYSDYVADKRVIQKNFKKRFKTLEKYLDSQRHRNLFEIGSAFGFYLDLVRDRFEKVEGIDITEEGVKYCRDTLKLEVIQSDLLDYDLQNRQFDVVCMWDTIEHLQNPHLYLEKISPYMQPGALLTITTGDIDSLNARTRKARWRLIHPPTHLHYFSKKTLTRLLNNYGFDVVYMDYCGFYRSLDNVAYNILVIRYKKPGLYNLIKKTGLTSLDFYLDLHDIVYIIGRKREVSL